MKGFTEHVEGLTGSFEVTLESDVGMGPCVWSVKGRAADGLDFHVNCASYEEAIGVAQRWASVPIEKPESVPQLTDRRGLIAHTRAMS